MATKLEACAGIEVLECCELIINRSCGNRAIQRKKKCHGQRAKVNGNGTSPWSTAIQRNKERGITSPVLKNWNLIL
jgi:hypothetical protein